MSSKPNHQNNPMTPSDSSRIQRFVDKLPNPTAAQEAFKRRASSSANRGKPKR